MQNYTQEEQDTAIKILCNLVNENQLLKSELFKAQEFCLRFLLSDNFLKNEKQLSFTDNKLIEYEEDWEKILPYFFFDFFPNSNSNQNLESGTYQSTFSIRIKDGTSYPEIGTSEEIKEKILQLSKRFFL